MKLEKFKITKLDKWNITYSEYREVECRNGTKEMQWVESGLYYSTLSRCLEGIKNQIINSYVNIEDYQEILDKINELNGAIVECNLKVKEVGDDVFDKRKSRL